MKRSRIVALGIVWAALIGIGAWRILVSVEEHIEESVREGATTRLAASVAEELQKRLGAQLQSALREGGPVAAIDVCGREALKIAEDIRREHPTVTLLRRTALRVRNPRNEPDSYERGWMARAAIGTTADRPVQRYSYVALLPDNRLELQYMEPIYLKPMCVLCHGTPEQIPSEVQDLLAQRYPRDRAVGFHPGEFRGVVSVHVAIPRSDTEGH